MIVDKKTALVSLNARGKLGYTAAVGFARCGISRCGSSKLYGGIYQRKKTLNGWRTSRMRYYRPSNPQTTAQQAWRSIFASGLTAWRALTDDERKLLSKQALSYRMTGFN